MRLGVSLDAVLDLTPSRIVVLNLAWEREAASRALVRHQTLQAAVGPLASAKNAGPAEEWVAGMAALSEGRSPQEEAGKRARRALAEMMGGRGGKG